MGILLDQCNLFTSLLVIGYWVMPVLSAIHMNISFCSNFYIFPIGYGYGYRGEYGVWGSVMEVALSIQTRHACCLMFHFPTWDLSNMHECAQSRYPSFLQSVFFVFSGVPFYVSQFSFFLPYLLCIFYGSLSHLMDRLIFGNQYFYPLLVESPIKDKIESLIVRSGSTSNPDQKLSESLNC